MNQAWFCMLIGFAITNFIKGLSVPALTTEKRIAIGLLALFESILMISAAWNLYSAIP